MNREPDDLEARRRRALYRASHRGMKEMDWLLGKFAETEVHHMDDDTLEDFERFLAVSDRDLEQWIIYGRYGAEGEFALFVGAIRQYHDIKP